MSRTRSHKYSNTITVKWLVYVAVWWLVRSVQTLIPFERVVISIIINKKGEKEYRKV